MSDLQREAEDIRKSHDGSIKWLIDLSPDEALRLSKSPYSKIDKLQKIG